MGDVVPIEERRARFRGFDDVDHFLRLAAGRVGGNPVGVWREYQIIFMGSVPLGVLPFPAITKGEH